MLGAQNRDYIYVRGEILKIISSLLLLVFLASAQSTDAVLSGTVLDQTARPFPRLP